MTTFNYLNELISLIPQISNVHAPGTPLYNFIKLQTRNEVEKSLGEKSQKSYINLGPYGRIHFPYHRMGETIDSLNLFDLDEMIIFSFYWNSRNRYKRVLDIGANLGLHTILLSKCGFDVSCFEPDPTHFNLLIKNLELNDVTDVKTFNAAVSNQKGTTEFIRVLGNTTGSHISGAKKAPYGSLDKIKVNLENFNEIVKGIDFIKMDVEGHEKEILLSTDINTWKNLDALVEVENEENANDIYKHFTSMGINLFSQKNNWQKVTCIEHIPTTYKEGMLFITPHDQMPWNTDK